MTFSSREEAGQMLGHRLAERGLLTDIVVGLPRGGVIVAAEVARVLNRPLDVIVVRKIGHPKYREFAVGAMAEHGVVLLNETALADTQVERAALDKVIAEETRRLYEYQDRFHTAGPRDFTDRTILIVDDGLATGATTEAAVYSARKQGAREVIVAAPVASGKAIDRLLPVADRVEALLVDPEFNAVGQYYRGFYQTTDEEVIAALYPHAARTAGA